VSKQDSLKDLFQWDEGKIELSMAELLAGMSNQEFFFHHQPIFDLRSGEQIGSEMLIRWIRRGKIYAPMWFMPTIERYGLNSELDQYVINRFLNIPWAETVKPEFRYRVFINISAQSFLDPAFIQCILKATENMLESDVLPVLELSERTPCEIELVKKQMVYIHNRGVEIALDDYGIGLSSLARLIELPVDILKIDRSIVCLIGQSRRAETILKSILQLAKDLSISVIAEGVETETQSNWLAENGRCWAQGFYYARPTENGFIQSPGPANAEVQ
jgi:EAL domain-containing protein (putative c-di-GMP-specific phosphodiesterase class I)